MKTISALELRAKVGKYLDEAAAGERIVVERAGQRLCAIVPLEDIERWDPDRRMARQLAALEEMRQFARLHPAPPGDTAEMIRRMRRERTDQILTAVEDARRGRSADQVSEEG
ncbi:MAG: type II toxin-antitoxin system Phd/YefM family antitoxin [Chloroflexota bacterium]